MSSTNLWRRLRGLNPEAVLMIGEIVATTPGGRVVQLLDGAQIAARGTGTIGTKVFVRDGIIEGEAPDLTEVLIEI